MTSEDVEAIEKLSNEKYQTWDWIFGYSPKYRFRNKLETESGETEIELLVEKGKLVEVSVSGVINPELSQRISEALGGCRHEYEEVKKRLVGMNEDLIKAMFK